MVRPSSRSRGLVDQERYFARLKAEVDKTVTFVNGVAAKLLAKEHMPVRFPVVVHVFLNDSCNLNNLISLWQRAQKNEGKVTYLYALLFEVVLLESFLCNANGVF